MDDWILATPAPLNTSSKTKELADLIQLAKTATLPRQPLSLSNDLFDQDFKTPLRFKNDGHNNHIKQVDGNFMQHDHYETAEDIAYDNNEASIESDPFDTLDPYHNESDFITSPKHSPRSDFLSDDGFSDFEQENIPMRQHKSIFHSSEADCLVLPSKIHKNAPALILSSSSSSSSSLSSRLSEKNSKSGYILEVKEANALPLTDEDDILLF